MLSADDARRTYLPGLTGLRGVGAVWVLCYHAQYGLCLPVAEDGFLGVDLFFILSGFVLSHAHREVGFDGPSYRRFLRDRIARIFPLHWAAMALLLGLLLLYPKLQHDMSQRFQAPDFVANLLLVQNWGFPGAGTWNGPAWSLSTEWLASLAFPLFLLGARRFTRPAAAACGCVLCLLAFAAFLYWTDNPTPDVETRSGIVRTFLEFAAGCLLHRIYLAGVRVPAWARWSALMLLAIGLSAPQRTMLAVFAFPVVILLAAQGSRTARLLSTRVVGFLGKISFSMYLLHWPLLQVSDRVEAELGIAAPLSLLWFLGFVALVLALSTVSYLVIENPARRLIRAGLRLPPVPASGRLLQLDR